MTDQTCELDLSFSLRIENSSPIVVIRSYAGYLTISQGDDIIHISAAMLKIFQKNLNRLLQD